jgi:hypothetical protein
MRRKSFGEFVDKKKRECVRELGLVKSLLERSGMKVENFLENDSEDEPYIYCLNPTKNGSFDGHVSRPAQRRRYRPNAGW